MLAKPQLLKSLGFVFGFTPHRERTQTDRFERRLLAFLIPFVVSSAWIAATPLKARCQVNSPKTNKEVIELCNRHTKQSATSASFDLNILGHLGAKLGFSKTKLIEISDSIYFLLGQEENDCRLLVSGIINKEEYRDSEARILETFSVLQRYRETAEKSAEERVSVKPTSADPVKLLEELFKKVPPPKAGVVKRPASFLKSSSVGEQFDEVIDLARKSRDRDY